MAENFWYRQQGVFYKKTKKNSDLKRWGKKIEKRRGKNRAAVALARHLAVIALAMLFRQTVYDEPLLKKQHQSTTLTVEELAILQDLAQEKGNIEIRSFQQLKSMIETAKA